MSVTVKWVAGTTGPFTTCFGASGADLNTISAANFALGSTVVSNGANLDLYADVSIKLASFTSGSAPYTQLVIMPLSEDGSTYGDGTTSGATLPASQFIVGSQTSKASATQAFVIYFRNILLPPTDFKFGLINQMGNPTAGSGNAGMFKTYNEIIA